jgi:hypothetical protein
VEALHRLLVGRLEGDVEPGRRRSVRAHEELVGREVALSLEGEAEADGLQHGSVERFAGLDVGDADVDVVEQASLVEAHRTAAYSRFPLTAGESLA